MREQVSVREGTFTEDVAGGALVGNRCQACGQTFFPRAAFCLSCFGDEVEDVSLGRRGTLYSYTVGYMPSTHFTPPYAVGYVDLPEGLRVFAPLKMVEDRPLRIGMEMAVTIEPLWQEGDREVVGYRFVPV
jgi:uncharacterized OB-fold protein